MSPLEIELIKSGQFEKAVQSISRNRSANLNYIDPETNFSVLMLAIYSAEMNQAGLALFVSFILNQTSFALINHVNPHIKQTAFDMAVVKAQPEVVQLFVDYHLSRNNLEACVFSHTALLKKQAGKTDLGKNALKYELTEAQYIFARKRYHDYLSKGNVDKAEQFKAELDRLHAIQDKVLYEVTMRYALETDDASICDRLDLLHPRTWRLANGAHPRDIAQELNKPNILAWFDAKTARFLSGASADSSHRLFAVKTNAVNTAQEYLQERNATIAQGNANALNTLTSSLSKMGI